VGRGISGARRLRPAKSTRAAAASGLLTGPAAINQTLEGKKQPEYQ
jgi:hypothetical protein